MKKYNKFFRVLVMTVIATVLLAVPAAANNIQNSTIYKGIVQMLNDASTALLVICPIAGGLAALYFVIRRSIADEQEGKSWTKRITTAIICAVAGMLVSGLIALITSYFTTV